jgi:hypothetical protein
VFIVGGRPDNFTVSGNEGFGFAYQKIKLKIDPTTDQKIDLTSEKGLVGGRPFLNVQFRWARSTKERWGPPSMSEGERRWASVKLDTGCDAFYAHPQWLIWNGVGIDLEKTGKINPLAKVVTAAGAEVIAGITSGTLRVQGFDDLRIHVRTIYYSPEFPEKYALVSHNVLAPYFGIVMDRYQTLVFPR